MRKQSKFHIIRLWLGHSVYLMLLGSLGFYITEDMFEDIMLYL